MKSDQIDITELLSDIEYFIDVPMYITGTVNGKFENVWLDGEWMMTNIMETALEETQYEI